MEPASGIQVDLPLTQIDRSLKFDEIIESAQITGDEVATWDDKQRKSYCQNFLRILKSLPREYCKNVLQHAVSSANTLVIHCLKSHHAKTEPNAWQKYILSPDSDGKTAYQLASEETKTYLNLTLG